MIVAKHNPIEEKLLSDDLLAEWLNDIAQNASKTIVSKDEWSWEVPDYWSRLKALEMEFKMKGHFREKAASDELPDGIYVFSD